MNSFFSGPSWSRDCTFPRPGRPPCVAARTRGAGRRGRHSGGFEQLFGQCWREKPAAIDWLVFFFFLARNVPPVESRSVCTVSPGNARWARTSLASVSSSLRKTDASINFAVRFLKPCKWVSFLCARQFTFPCEVDFASRYVVRISNLEVGVFFSRVLLRYLVRYLSFLVISSSFFFPTLLKKGGRG